MWDRGEGGPARSVSPSLVSRAPSRCCWHSHSRNWESCPSPARGIIEIKGGAFGQEVEGEERRRRGAHEVEEQAAEARTRNVLPPQGEEIPPLMREWRN